MLSTRCRRFSPSFAFQISLLALLPLATVAKAHAATVVVNTTADSTDAPGSCGSDTCSLRDAISQASAGDTIAFAPSLAGTITLGSELPDITQDLTIQGPGASVLTISGANAYRVFTIYPPFSTATVSISGLTLANGTDSVEGGALSIYQRSAVTVDRVVFEGNTSPSGGAIVNDGTLTVTNSTFRNNSAGSSGYGGAISAYTPLLVASCTFVGNTAYIGAGIYNSNSTVTVINSTFVDNSNAWIGTVHNNSGSLTISNSSFAANTAGYSGGGGGIASNGGTFSVTNALVDVATECYSNVGGCPASNDPGGNLVGATKLAPLGYYGGPTPTMLPLPGSSAICAGLANNVPASANGVDQRGFPVNTSCVDAGAVQTNYLQVNTSADSDNGPCSGAGTCSLRDAIGTAPYEDIDFASSLNGSTIALGSELPAITGNTTIIGPGADQLAISGGNVSRAFYVTTGSLSLYGLTLDNGNASGYADGSGGLGGAIFNAGTLAVGNVAFSGNSAGTATANHGGAIYNGSGTILGLTGSTFSKNTAGQGSALYNGSAASLPLSYSTFFANSASDAGALYNASGGRLSLANSTFAGNVASGTGGVGSGIVNAGSLTATNTLVHDDASAPECSTSTSSPCPASGDGHGNVVFNTASANALSPLGSYGGPTPVTVPLPGSPAICGGLQYLLPVGVTTDQRGYPNTTSTYTGYTAAAPCVDAGAVQTAYSGVQWVQQPSDTSANANMSPAPTVEVLETNPATSATDAVNGIGITLTLNGSGTLSGGSATTSGGPATFSALSVNTAGTNDSLSTDAITVLSNATGTTTLPSQTSNTFNVLAAPVLSVQISAAGTFTQGSTGEWIVTVGNTGSVASTIGTTFFSDTLPTGYTVSGFGSTSGWSCSGTGTQTASCTTTQTIAAGGTYPSIQLVVNIPANSPTSVSDTAYTWGGGDSVHTSLATAASATSTVSVEQALASVTVSGSNATLTYSPSGQAVILTATVTSPTGTVSEGTMTFTVLSGGTPTGTAVSATVSSGTTSASYLIPAGTSAGTYTVQASYSDASGSFASGSDTSHTLTIGKETPVITWAVPTAISYGTALSPAQLDATANVSGIFAYTPGTGTVLSAGTQTLSVSFSPADPTDYMSTTATVQLVVNKGMPSLTWANPAAITYGVALSSAQLNATANVPGTFVYSPAAGTVLSAGTQPLSATFTPTDTSNYSSATATVQLTVNKATPTITWTPASAIPYGTTLAGILTASATQGGKSLSGTFSYTAQASGGPSVSVNASTILSAGSYALVAVFVPADTADYGTATAAASLTITGPVLTVFANNDSRVYGTANPVFTGSVSGAVNGDTFTETFTTSATISSSVGQYSIVPSASGANLSNYMVVVQNGTLTITKAGSSTVLHVSSSLINLGGSVTLSAAVKPATTGTPTGTVSFYDGTTLLNTVSLTNGAASYSTTLSAGLLHSITAVYNGDLNFDSSSSSAVLITVAPLSFTLSASPASLTGTAGTSFSYQLTIAPMFGSYPAPVQFAAVGIPAGSQVSFSPATIDANAGPQVITMCVHTAGTVAANRSFATDGRLVPAFLALLLVPFAGARKMRRAGRGFRALLCLLLLALSGIAATTGLTGCGSNAVPGAATYTIQVMATSGDIQQSTTVDLHLQ